MGSKQEMKMDRMGVTTKETDDSGSYYEKLMEVDITLAKKVHSILYKNCK